MSSVIVAIQFKEIVPSVAVIREQTNMILSIYNQYVKAGGGLALADFIDHQHSPMFVREFELIRFQYHRIIQHYLDLFGAKRFLVLPYEMFAQQPKAYGETILTFCGLEPADQADNRAKQLDWSTSVNQSYPQPLIFWLYRINRLISHTTPINRHPLIPLKTRQFTRRLNRYFGARISTARHERAVKEAKELIRETVGDFYAESNAKTAELTTLDLRSYGYKL